MKSKDVIERPDPENFNQFIELTPEEIQQMARENAQGPKVAVGVSEISLAEFLETSKTIVATLKSRGSDLSEDEYTRYVYNEAINDAIKFVSDLAVSNPTHRLAYMSLEREMKKWLPLKTEGLK